LVEFLEKNMREHQPVDFQPNVKKRNVSASIVQVVTGTGSHSTSAGGPVLKYAVNDFLQRHSFQYSYHSKGGYFVIPMANNTGFLSYQSKMCNVDTKIIIASSSSTAAVDKSFRNHLRKRHDGLKSSLSASNNNKPHHIDVASEMPTLQEVAYDDKQLERGKNGSLEECRIRQREYSKEQTLYQQAVYESKLETQKADEEEKLLLERVIQESIDLSEHDESDCIDNEGNDDYDYDIALKQAVLESIKESERTIDDDELLQRAIRESEAIKDASEREDEEEFQIILQQLSRIK
jgi:hypothetical protein